MNFVGKFDAQLPNDGSTAHSHVHVEHPTAHAPADAIIISDAHLLFGADFKRSGVDLILSNADRELVVRDYFKGEHHRALASPDGAHLTGDIVNALTGQVDYAQAADGTAAVAHVIGHVTKLAGSATAIRNGVSIILNQGDNVEKGDVVATGSDSTLGVTFIDGTVFGLSSNARMVLNEMVYDPNGSNNSSLISLVSGTISFVAGETAKHGDMKVDTPVATMGIRGTAVLVEIDFNVPGANGLPDAKFQVLVEPDGTTGSYILFDKTTLDPIATVNKAGQQVNINQNGISYTNSPLSPELQKLISDVFTQKFSNTDTNTKLVEHFTDSIVPPTFQSISGPTTVVIQTVFIPTNTLGNGPSQTQGPGPNKGHVDLAPTVGATNAGSVELAGVTGSTKFDTASGFITFQDVNLGDQPTASAKFNSFAYQNALHQDITHNLTPTEQAAVQAVEIALNVTQDPLGQANGTALWTYSISDDALDFLGAGETLTLTYLVTVSNNFAQSILTTTVPITVTITGNNDVPKIDSAVPQTIAFQGGTNVPGGDLTAHVPTSGTIVFDDPDLTDTHTVSVSNPTSTLTDPTTGKTTAFTLPPTPLALFNQALTASITDPTTGLPTDSTGTGIGSVSWSLAELPVWLGDYIPLGDILTLTYVVTVTDSQGATAKQDITVTITGTASPAVVWIATTGTGPAPDGLWSTGHNWETGEVPTAASDAIIITDQLEGLTPTYPVTITSAVGIDGAAANSLTMDNFGGAAPVLINQDTLAIGTTFDINDHSTGNPPGYTGPEFDNQGTATVGGAFNMNADAVVNNSGYLTVDGKMEVLDQSSLQNSGTITLAGGGDFSGQSTISNTTTGAIIDVTGGTLNVGVDISNLGTIEIDSPGALTLSGATIDGGTVTNKGTLTLNGAAVLKNGVLGNSSQINVSGAGNALDNERLTNTGGIEVIALGALTLDLLTTVGNAGHTITVDGTGTLTLQGGSSITGGNLSNSGTVDIEGTGATLDGVTVTGGGAVNVDVPAPAATTLVLKDVTSITKGTLTVGPAGVLSVAGSATLDHVGVTNQNSIEVTAANALTFDDGTTVDNTVGRITVDGTGKLTLNGASINGGTINDFSTDTSGDVIAGDIDVAGSSTISNAALNQGNVKLENGVTLTLDGSTVTKTSFDDTATGATIQVDGGAANTLTLNDVHINGGTVNDFSTDTSGDVIAGDIDVTGSSTISNAALNQGNVKLENGVTLTLDGSTVTKTSFDDTADGATIQIDGGQANTLTLSGVHINGGTVNDFSTDTSGDVIAGDIDVTGSSGISNAAVNNGNVTLGTNVTLTLTNDTVAGTSFADTASGATIQIVGNTTLDHVTVSGGAVTNTFNNTGTTITIDGGQTLKLQDGATVSGGTINNSGTLDIEKSTGATLDGVTVIGGGAIQVDPAIQVTTTPLVLEGGTSITGGTLTVGATSGSLVVETAAGATLDHVGVTNDKSIEVFAGSNLTLDDGTTVDNGSGTLTVDGSGKLTLNDASINGGTINNFSTDTSGNVIAGDIDVTGSSTISNAHLNNGNVTLGGNVTLTLEGSTVTGTSFDDTATDATIQIDGGAANTLTLSGAIINGGTVNNFSTDTSGDVIAGDIDVTGDSTISNAALNQGNVKLGNGVTLTLDGSTVTSTSFDDTATGATIQIDGGEANTLTLSGATINGGTINDFSTDTSGNVIAGDIDVTGDSTISNAALNNGNVTIGGNLTLTLGNDTVTGTSFADTASGATIQIVGNTTLDDVIVNGGAVTNATITVDGGETLTLQDGVTVSGGTLSNSGTLDIESSTGATLDGVTITGGGAIDVDTPVPVTLTTLVLKDVTSVTDGTLAVGLSGILSVAGSATLDHVGVTNQNSIEITAGNALTLDDQTSVDNGSGTITVDGTATLTLNDASITGGTINNFSTDTSGDVIAGDIDVTGDSTIGNATLNKGNVTVGTGVTLTLDGSTVNGASVDATAAGATIQIDADAANKLTLNGATINGGTINDFTRLSLPGATVFVSGEIDLTGSSTISNAILLNGAVVVGDNATLTLDGSTADRMLFDDAASGATIQIDGGDTLTLNGTIINGGTINNFSTDTSGDVIAGDIDLNGGEISNAALNKGNVTLGVDSTVTLDGSRVTGTSFDDTATGATIQIDGGAANTLTLSGVHINGGTINDFSTDTSGNVIAGDIDVTGSSTISNAALNQGNVKLGNGVTLTLDGSTVTKTSFDDTATGATIQIDSGEANTLTLNGANFNGGTINNFSTDTSGDVIAADIDVTGSSGISNATLNNGNVKLENDVHLGFDNATVNGTSFDDTDGGATIDTAGTLTLNDVSINGGTIHNFSGQVANTIDVTGSSIISNAQLNGGDVTLGGHVTLTLDGTTVNNGTSFDDTASGATIQIDGNDTLTLNGASINGGTINDFSTDTSGNVIAGDIDVTGNSTISNAALNNGNVTIGNDVHLTLDGSTVTGTSFYDTASGAVIQVDGDAGDTVHLSGVGIKGGGLTVAANGLLQTSGNVTLTDTGVTNDGTIEVTSGKLTITGTSSVADSAGHTVGTIQIDGGATLDLNASDTENVSFSGTGGELKIDTTSFGGSIVDLAAGDQIDLATIGYGPGTTATYVSNADDTGGTLKVTDGTNSIALQLVGDYSNGHFAGSADSAGDTLITLHANDDAPAFTPSETAQTATVAEIANVTNSPTTDHSSPAGGTIHFTDIDLTDRPTASVTQTVTWTGGTLSDLEANELKGAFQLAQPVTNTNNGEIDWTYAITDGSLDFLGANQIATVTSTITLDDHQQGTTTATVTITIDGANDVPTISATGGGLTELPNVTNGGATDTTTGTITFSDADVTDRPTVTASFTSFDYKDAAGDELTLTPTQQAALEKDLTLTADSGNTNNGTVGWSYSVADSALDFMAAGDKLVLTYTATVNDHNGGTTTTPVTVTINGSDDAPTVGFAPAHLQFDGHSAAVGPVATTNIGNGTDGVTLDGWVNWNGIGDTSHGQILFYNGNTSTAGFGMFSVPTAGGSLDLEILAGGETLIDTGIKLTAGQWYNVALSHVNDIFTLDVDGAVVYTSGPQGAFAMGHLNTPDFTLIGGNSGGTESFNGGIADVSVWNIALSQSQVQAIEFGTLSGTEPGLAAYYPLNDGSGTTATDAVNSAGNLSFVGNPAWQTSGSWPDSSVSTAENHAITINGISVNDVDAGSSQIEVTLAAGHGALSLENSAGLDSVHTNSDGSINLFGSQAAIDTALSHGVIYTPVTDFSGADTITVTANDQVSAALGGPLTGTGQITVNVEPGTPTFSSMTLSIAQGGTDVLTDANFSISDPDTSHFLYSVNNVTGGQFEVFNGTNWVSAPTGGFTTAQIEAGHVEFVQDGTNTAPGFSITAADGTNVSAPISPTVNFTPTPPVAHDDVLSGPSGSGWVLDTDNGHYYREVTTLGSFETAVANAVADGGYLATITSTAEQSFVVNHVIDGFSATWLGGETNNDRPDGSTVNESIWTWVTGPEAGTQFTYTNWNPGEPSGGFGATTQWLQIGPTGGWNDAPDAGQLGDGVGAGYLEEWGGTPTQITFLENTGTAIATSVLLANDTDVNGLPLTVTAVGDTNGHSAHGGTVSLNGNVITYTPSTDYSGADSFTYTISDGNGTSTATVSFDVQPGTPDFTGMTLTIAQGGTEVLSDANFSITDPDTSHFLYTVNDVTGGQFEVFNGTNWVDAPTGGFTTQQIEAGHVEFVQDGTATAPSFSIFATDGTSASATISPTVDFIQPHALAPANLIVNGGFETYDYTGWTISGVATPDSVVVGPYHEDFSNDVPHTGSHEALVGSQPEEMTLSQTVATTDGAHYTVDFWAMQDQPPIIGDDFSASWNGTTLTSLVDVGQQSGYTEYQFDVTGAAGSASSTLTFSANNEGYWDIDDVSVLKGAPTTVQEMSDTTTAVAGVNATDTLTVTPSANAIGSVSATAGNGTVEWQFQATNAQLDHLMGLTQSFTVTDTTNPSATQTVAVSVGGNGNDQFVFHAGVGADTMVNFSTLTTAQGAYAGDTIALEQFNGITSVADVLTHLGADSHGNAVVDLGNHDSITFQGLSVAQIQANASHIFQV